MGSRVGIIGISESRCEGMNRKDSLNDLIFETTSRALEDAGIHPSDIDTVVMAEYDQVDGRLIGAMSAALAAHCYDKDEIRVEDDGMAALAIAYMRCLSGNFNTALVVSWAMCSQTNLDILTRLNFDPFFHRPLGLNWMTAHAIQTLSYMNQWGITEEQGARVTVKNRLNAVHNPNAHLRVKVSLEEVLQSKYVSWPLRRLNLPPHSDGACAMVLSTEEIAQKSDKPIAWIKGIGWANDTYYLGDKDLWRLPSLAIAARRAYTMAKIQNPLKEIDVAEVYDITSFHELMEYEALGFCKEGEAGKFIDRGITSMEGELPVNPSGGMLSSNPYTAVGLFRVAEAALQVTGRAEGRQVANAKVALAHAMSGMCGQSNFVVILSSG